MKIYQTEYQEEKERPRITTEKIKDKDVHSNSFLDEKGMYKSIE